MQIPPAPDGEALRIAMLQALRLLDTPPEARFDRFTRIAQRLFDVPIATIGLVDDRRQWFKSRIGIRTCQTPREVSLCGHTIAGSGPLLVADARIDPRFADNPLVTGAPHIRSYAGVPLAMPFGGMAGTLSVIDRRPRSWSNADVALLVDLGDLLNRRAGHPGRGDPRSPDRAAEPTGPGDPRSLRAPVPPTGIATPC